MIEIGSQHTDRPLKGSGVARAKVIDIQEALGKATGFPPLRVHEHSGSDVNLVRVRPGQGPEVHEGAKGYSCLFVLEGSVFFRCAEESFELRKGQMVFVPPGASRGFRGGDHGADLLALHLPA